MDECRNIHADVVDRFRVNNKNQAKMIFVVDETLIQIEGKDYCWLWIAQYESDMDLCSMMMHISRERTILVCYQFFRVTEEIWQKTHIHRWC